MLFNTFSYASRHTSSFGKNQHDGSFPFILQRSLQRSRSRKKELCKQQVLSETKEGAESGHEEGSHWSSHLHWARIPNRAGFLFTLPDLPCPKTDTRIRQLLPLPASSSLNLRASLNLKAGSSIAVFFAVPHTKQLRIHLSGCRILT